MRSTIVIASLLAALPAAADDAAPAEDPRAAITDRGIVLKAGKRNLIVIVPPATLDARSPAGTLLYQSTIYFGDAKALFRVPGDSWSVSTKHGDEKLELQDPRALYAGTLIRKGDTFALHCYDFHDNKTRKFELTAADVKQTTAVTKAATRTLHVPYAPYLLARVPDTTTYLYVDRSRAPDSNDFRLFQGKRGAMKQVKFKEVAVDVDAFVGVTAKGTLSIKLSQGTEQPPTAKFGPTTKQQDLEVMKTYENRGLVHRELGVYTRDRTGFPCDEL